LAIALVVAAHVGSNRLGGGAWTVLLAEFGVQVFFVLSGYLITALLLREERATGSVDRVAFMVRRSLRLMPALFVFVAVVAVLKLLHLVTDEPWYSFASGLLYFRNIIGRGEALPHLWSLALEEQFYLLWPTLFLVFRRRRLRAAVAILVGVCVLRTLGIIFHVQPYASGVFYVRPWYRFDSPMAGCVLALAVDAGGTPRALAERVAGWSPLGLVLSIGALAAIGQSSELFRPFYFTAELVLGTWLVVHVVLRPNGALSRTLSQPICVLTGILSYSLYLWHVPFCVPSQPSWGPLRAFPVCVAASLAAAAVSYRFIERPFLRTKVRFERASLATSPVSVPAAPPSSHTHDVPHVHALQPREPPA
jgi:peptidoglycan/LPS O-acetylase OafA/YrhL